MSQATRRAPGSRLTTRRLLDSIATYLGGGAVTNLQTDRGSITSTTRIDPDTLRVKQTDGTQYQLRIERV